MCGGGGGGGGEGSEEWKEEEGEGRSGRGLCGGCLIHTLYPPTVFMASVEVKEAGSPTMGA